MAISWRRSIGGVGVELVVGRVLCGLLIGAAFLKITLLLELRKPQRRAGFIADLHALAEAALGVEEAVEGEEVDSNGEGLDADLNDGADNNPILVCM